MNNELTQAELQYLTKMFTNILRESKDVIPLYKKEANFYWLNCDKENKSTKKHFDILNDYKNHIREETTHRNKLMKIQAKLKKKMGERHA